MRHWPQTELQVRGRNLSRAEAIEQYALYRMRLYDYLRAFQIITDIMDPDGAYHPKDAMGHGSEFYISTLKDSVNGLFVSMIDRDRRALNVFDVWLVLFPQSNARILAVWREIEPLEGLLRDYRNKVAYHVENDLGSYLRTRSTFQQKRKEITSALQAFFGLAKDLVLAERTDLPCFRAELEAILKREFPGASSGMVENLLDYVGGATAEG